MEATKKEPGQTTRSREKKVKPPMTGSEEAKRTAAVVLEVMSGEKGPPEAAEALGLSTMRYYVLEERALQGMVVALEPRPKGPRAASPEETVRRAEKERDRMKREVGRMQALLRMMRKSVHLREPQAGTRVNGKKRRRPIARVQKMLARLRPAAAAPVAEAATEA